MLVFKCAVKIVALDAKDLGSKVFRSRIVGFCVSESRAFSRQIVVCALLQ